MRARGARAGCRALLLLLVTGAVLLPPALAAQAPTRSYRVIHTFPHDREAFTQGLIWEGGYLYESTGLEGRSSLRKVDLASGRVVERIDVNAPYFAEGLTGWQGRLFQLTWVSHVGFVYDQTTLRKLSEFRYRGEGWGLTHDDAHFILSDGSDTLRYLDPATFSVTGSLPVRDGRAAVKYLNELEWIQGEIWANVWQTSLIACISPQSGRVLRWIDLSGLLTAEDEAHPVDVLNGIAYDGASNRIFVTGKLWPKLFEIRVEGE